MNPEGRLYQRFNEAQKNREEQPANPSRRIFLGIMAAAGVAASLTASPIKRFMGGFLGSEQSSNFDKGAVNPEKGIFQRFADAISGEAKLHQKNFNEAKSIAEILNYKSPGRITFDQKTVRALTNYEKAQYRKEEKLRPESLKHKTFIQAYNEIGKWKKEFEAIFKQYGVPLEYIYLAIPESHFEFHTPQNKIAEGPYQFTAGTAKLFKLRVDDKIDERHDPIKSAIACAKLLRELYNETGDWDLALSGYNGSFFREYLKIAKSKNDKPTYAGFCKLVENKINAMRSDIQRDNCYFYTARKDISLRKIAIGQKADLERICQANGFAAGTEITVKNGQKIKIPLKNNLTKAEKERKFIELIAGFKENLQYPARFHATIELIDEYKSNNKIKTNIEPISYDIIHPIAIKKPLGKNDEHYFTFFFNKKTGKQDMKPITKKMILTTESLLDIAKRTERSLPQLLRLNPAIKDYNAPLEEKYEIRLGN
jgi:hypothetical protein